MAGFEPADFDLASLEVVDIYTAAPDGTASDNLVATIFYKPNEEPKVHGGCLFQKPVVEKRWNLARARHEVVRTLITIVTTTRAVVEFERQPGGVYRMITCGYTFGQVDRILP